MQNAKFGVPNHFKFQKYFWTYSWSIGLNYITKLNYWCDLRKYCTWTYRNLGNSQYTHSEASSMVISRLEAKSNLFPATTIGISW